MIECKNFITALDKYYLKEGINKSRVNAHLKEHHEKLNHTNELGYADWMKSVLDYMSVNECNNKLNNEKLKILDIGSGTGEFVVLMNALGHDATGIDLHTEHLELANILAKENNMDESTFIFNDKKSLPFKDNAFDLITSFSVFEHLEDEVLEWMLPEIFRVCRGCVFTLVPNPIKPIDDHTGLAFLGHMPRWLAIRYISLRGEKYKYSISRSGEWDVYYRYLNEIKKVFNKHNFQLDYLPDEYIYPSLEKCPPVHRLGKNFNFFGRQSFIGISLFPNLFINFGTPKQYFYPYLNLISRPLKND